MRYEEAEKELFQIVERLERESATRRFEFPRSGSEP